MKKILLLSLISLFATVTFAQNTRTVVVSEGFDYDFPPDEWTITTTNSTATWIQGNGEVNFSTIDENSLYSAIVPVAESGPEQDEWLVSPLIYIPQNSLMSFYAMFNWSKLPVGGSGNPGATIKFMISNDGGTNWTQMWDANNTPQFSGYQWKHRYVDLASYAGTNMRFAWVVTGFDGGVFAVDGIEIISNLDNDITIEPTIPFDGVFNFVQIPLSQIDALNAKLQEYFEQITPELSFYQCIIHNNGRNIAHNAYLKAFVNNSLIGQTTPVEISPGSASDVVGIPSLLNFVMGTNLVSYEIVMDSIDQNPSDNYASEIKVITENIYAVDSVNSFSAGYSNSGMIGNLFAIPSKTHVINGIQLAFSQSSHVGDKFKVSFYFYQTADNIFNGSEPNLTLPFFTYEISKNSDMIGGFGNIILPYLRFPQFGTYLLMIEPITGTSDLCYDETDVMSYFIDENNDVVPVTGYGAMGCRLIIDNIPTSSCDVNVTNMKATDNCDNTVTFSWDATGDHYLLSLSYMEGGNYYSREFITDENEVEVDNLDYRSYTWSVTPYNNEGVSGGYFSQTFIYTDHSLFEPVGNLSAVVNPDNVILSWNKPNVQSVTGFQIYQDGYFIESVPDNITSYSIQSNDEESEYGVRVVYNYGCYSEMATILVDAVCVMPSSLELDATVPNTVTMTWDLAADGARYYIYRDGNLLTESPINSNTYTDRNVPGGNYYYGVTAYYNVNGCESEMIDSQVKVFDGIADITNNIMVYPNPADSYFVVKGENLEQIVVYDVIGQQVLVRQAESDKEKIDVTSWNPGIYIVSVKSVNAKPFMYKLVRK